jgi:hypothetical protein
MLMPLEMMRSFSDEFAKISMDAGQRATLAAKMGDSKNYLQGGELPSNGPSEVAFIPKIGQQQPEQKGDLKERARDMYLHARGPAGAAIKGGFPGVFLGNFLTGGRLGASSPLSRLGLRGFGALGAGVGLADYYLAGKHNQNTEMINQRVSKRRAAAIPQPSMQKTAGMMSQAFTPARQLTRGAQTGSFKEMVHMGDRLRPPKVGQKFNFPGTPAPVQ